MAEARTEEEVGPGRSVVDRRHRERHFGPREYIRVALILGIITLFEVWVYYIEGLRDVLVPILLICSALKFTMVVLYFMHLRFDNRSFAVLFLGGMALALTVFAVVLIMFGAFSG
jgi:cytochrome c oxidase subunit 4